jgi:hypothetical protein
MLNSTGTVFTAAAATSTEAPEVVVTNSIKAITAFYVGGNINAMGLVLSVYTIFLAIKIWKIPFVRLVVIVGAISCILSLIWTTCFVMIWYQNLTNVEAIIQLLGIFVGLLAISMLPAHCCIMYIKWNRLKLTRKLADPLLVTVVTAANFILLPSQVLWDISMALVGLDTVNGNYGSAANMYKSTAYLNISVYCSMIDLTFGIFVEIFTCLLIRSIIVNQSKTQLWRAIGFFEMGVIAVGLFCFVLSIFMATRFEFDFASAIYIPTYRLFNSLILASAVNCVESVKKEVSGYHPTTFPGHSTAQDNSTSKA